MGQHGQPKDLAWADTPAVLRYASYVFVILLMAGVLIMFGTFVAWLIGHPFASGCTIK